MEEGLAWDEEHCSGDVVRQALLDNYRYARTLLENLVSDFRAREALLANDRVPVSESSYLARLKPAPVGNAERPSPTVALFCLGKFRVEVDGRLVDTRTGSKSLAVLKYLAGRGSRPTPRDLLLEALWPDTDPEAAGNRLRVAVHGLRRHLPHLGSSLDIITYQDGGYLLNPTGTVWIDADVFEDLWRQGVRLERLGRSGEAAQAYSQAELLYRGDYLEEDLYEEWTLLRREGLRDAYMDLLGKLAASSIAQGDYGGCIICCQKILAQDPCREDAYRLLMRCHALTGQRARALRWYEICAATLRRELEVDPSPETAALHGRVLRGESL